MRRLLRIREVQTATGMARSSIYAAIQHGDFPAPIRLSARTSAWPADEVEAWIDDRIAASRRNGDAA